MTRAALPHRRQNETIDLDHNGHRFTVTVGYSEAGDPLEVFADGAKIGTDMAHTVADACVIISLALQHGCPAGSLVKSVGVVPDPFAGEDATRPASVLGVIARIVASARAPWAHDHG